MSLTDPRLTKQAKVIVDYSLKVKPKENVAIIADFVAKPLVLEIYKLLIKRGVNEVIFHFSDYEFTEAFFKNASSSQLKAFPQIEMDEVKKVDSYIGISSPTNTRGLTSIDATKIGIRAKVKRPITDYRVEKTKWVITRFATDAQAQEANMSLTDYQDFVFSAVNGVDWAKLQKDQERLKNLVNKTKKVHILGKDTALKLNITGRKAVNAGGEFNMPDGEVFTSVLEDSTDGFITYSFPALYYGREFHEVRLEFKKGKVVKATATKEEKALNKILDTDPGARRIGELGIGNNFKIDKFTKDILFDEKIGGSIHLALGSGYKETGSLNNSGIHWDMIKDLREGGEIYFDKKLVQKNGKWL